jgi:hypothetical protein
MAFGWLRGLILIASRPHYQRLLLTGSGSTVYTLCSTEALYCTVLYFVLLSETSIQNFVSSPSEIGKHGRTSISGPLVPFDPGAQVVVEYKQGQDSAVQPVLCCTGLYMIQSIPVCLDVTKTSFVFRLSSFVFRPSSPDQALQPDTLR